MQSEQLKEHIITIQVESLLINSALYENRYLDNIIKSYKSEGKCDNQQRYKDIM